MLHAQALYSASVPHTFADPMQRPMLLLRQLVPSSPFPDLAELAATIKLLEDAYTSIKEELSRAGILNDEVVKDGTGPASAATGKPGWAWLQDDEFLSSGSTSSGGDGGSSGGQWLQGVFARGGKRRDVAGRRDAFPKLTAVVDTLLQDAYGIFPPVFSCIEDSLLVRCHATLERRFPWHQ